MKTIHALIFAAILTLTGCASMNKPLIFDDHELSTLCFEASGMRVKYGSFVTEDCPALMRKKSKEDEKAIWGVVVGFKAFNGPLKVQWKSADGTSLSTTLNLEEVFPGKRILHSEDPKQIEPTLPVFTTPYIIVEVNDRTLSIYMDVFVGLKTDEPGKLRRLSRNRHLAYKKTFN